MSQPAERTAQEAAQTDGREGGESPETQEQEAMSQENGPAAIDPGQAAGDAVASMAPDTPGLPRPEGGDDRPLDPQKLLRVASLAREVLEELRRMPPQTEGTDHLVSVYKQVRKQLSAAMPNKLVEELEAIELDLAFKDGATNDEVRVAYSALIGWLGGLFQGLQAATLHAQAIGELERHLGQGREPSRGTSDKEGYL